MLDGITNETGKNGGDTVLVVVLMAYTGSGVERRGSVVVGLNLVAETWFGGACCIESGVRYQAEQDWRRVPKNFPGPRLLALFLCLSGITR